MPNQTKLVWTPWISETSGNGGSRNLTRIGGTLDKTIKSLHIGAEEAMKALVNLPATRHDINGPPERFCVDAFPVAHGEGMALLLILHGQFAEVGTEGVRSFDRSFVLIPAPQGSRPQLNGWDVMILSDQWTIRSYSNYEAWKPGPLIVQPPPRPLAPRQPLPQKSQHPKVELPAAQQAALANIPEPQRSLVLQICMQTRLNVDFAVQCLEGNGWDLQRAVANFNEVKGQLSKGAFL